MLEKLRLLSTTQLICAWLFQGQRLGSAGDAHGSQISDQLSALSAKVESRSHRKSHSGIEEKVAGSHMPSKATEKRQVQLGDLCPRFVVSNRTRFIVTVLSVLLLLSFVEVGKNSQAATNEKCGEALTLLAAAYFQDKSARLVADGVCVSDVMSYVDFVAFVLSLSNEPTPQELEARLLKSAESGNISAKIQYTLVFTDILNSKFTTDMLSLQTYSRYAPYIVSFYEFGRWQRDRNVDDFYLLNMFANTAITEGVLEAYLLKFLFNAVAYKSSKEEVFKADAATSLLVLADFLGKIEPTLQYLGKRLSTDVDALKPYGDRARSIVDQNLTDTENRQCARRKECIFVLNLKRLSCQIRDQSGEALYTLDVKNCERLSDPLTRLYRKNFERMFVALMSNP